MTQDLLIILASFVACAVEMVEALTIVVAAGVTRGWRSAIEGVLAALCCLVVIVGGVGVPLVHLVPIDTLRVIIGGLLMILGLSWLRKAVLRASGHKAMHDEDVIYAKKVKELSANAAVDEKKSFLGSPLSTLGPRDATGFAVAFKGVFLEGLEVALIVISLGSSSHHFLNVILGAVLAAVVVFSIGAMTSKYFSRVPENKMKMTVGILLSSFGLFWIGEGTKVSWPGNDLSILWLIGVFALLTLAYVRFLKNMLVVKHNAN
ncbi:MAG: hypothetical protein M1374_07200 [Firmicutes bacterium]|jgi:uncharacterized membrane protein|nr:hypothetical protein [Bacillota bacterium]